MSTTLLRRIADLEAKVSVVPPPSPPSFDAEQIREFGNALKTRMVISEYADWRHEGLSLEELLALARYDDGHFAAHPKREWSPGPYKRTDAGWIDRSGARAAREFEIRILERDGEIGDAAAQALRDNCWEHFSEDGPPLDSLPRTIAMDQERVLASALKKCPRRYELPLKEQIAHLHEDRRRDLLEREQRKSEAARRGHTTTFTPATLATLASIDAFGDRLFELRVAALSRSS